MHFTELRPPALIVAGALISAGITLVIEKNALFVPMFVTAVILILFGLGYFHRWCNSWVLKNRKRHPKIGHKIPTGGFRLLKIILWT